MSTQILGVNIDNVSMAEVLITVEKWIRNPGKHYIVTPNLEFILAAQQDQEFKEVLNKADLRIPDSSRLSLSYWLLGRSKWIRMLFWPLFFLPLNLGIQFDVVTGTDLTEALSQLSAEKGFTVGFLGGKNEVAEKAAGCLKKKYPGLKVVFAEDGGEVNDNGQSKAEENIVPCDLLFVAFGQKKQEKWIANNLEKIPVHVAMGVGGTLDYLSGNVPRAPEWIRALKFEWLFRLIVQPWRIKRQLVLVKYLWLLVVK